MANPGGKRVFLSVLAVLAVAGVAIALWLEPWKAGAESQGETETGTERKPTGLTDSGAKPGLDGRVDGREPVDDSVDDSEESPYHWILTATRKSLPVLLLAESGIKVKSVLCVPLTQIPIERFESKLDIAVQHVNWELGVVLLSAANLDAHLPPSKEPLGISSEQVGSGMVLEAFPVIRPGKAKIAVTVESRLAARIALSRSLAAGTVIVTPQGRALALVTVDGSSAVLLAQFRPWLNAKTESMPLAKLQQQIRNRDPHLLLQDADKLIHEEPLTRKRVDEVIEMLQKGQHLARDWKTSQSFAELLKEATHRQVMIVARTDATEAMRLGQDALQRYPDHKALLAEMSRIAMDQGQGLVAAGYYERLLSASAEHGKSVANDIGSGLLNLANKRQREKRNREAMELLQRASTLFPERADLRLALARSLMDANRYDDALAQAQQAARLDASYQRHVARYERASQRSHKKGVYQIPYDPKTRVIRTKASISGQSVRFLVDTGATLTTIPTSVAKALGLLDGKNRMVRMTTANGTVEVPVVTLPSLRLGPLRAKNIEAAVLDLPGAALAGTGLLGMNVLERWNVQIDTQNGRLVLTNPGRRK